MTHLIIARHGNTFEPGDVIRRVGARTDLPLSSSGREQAVRLGHYLGMLGLLPDQVYVSELRRTRQTAELALQAAAHDAPIMARAQFNEVDYGVDEGQPETAVAARVGQEALKAWEEHNIVPEGWRADPKKITADWHDFMTLALGKQTLVVTSNGIARFAPVITGDIAAFRSLHSGKLATGAVGIIENKRGQWVVTGWNIKPPVA